MRGIWQTQLTYEVKILLLQSTEESIQMSFKNVFIYFYHIKSAGPGGLMIISFSVILHGKMPCLLPWDNVSGNSSVGLRSWPRLGSKPNQEEFGWSRAASESKNQKWKKPSEFKKKETDVAVFLKQCGSQSTAWRPRRGAGPSLSCSHSLFCSLDSLLR